MRREEEAAPPRLAAWLLRRVLPPGTRGASIAGDLLEEFRADAASRSLRTARRRYWRHALSIALRYGPRRGRRGAAPRARRLRMSSLLRDDLRHATRALARTPGFTIIALTTLALGVGAATAIFSLAYTILLRPLPFADPQRLVFVSETTPPLGTQLGIAWLNFVDWQARATSFDDLACSVEDGVNLTGGRPRRLDARNVTWNFFRTLGTRPALGRLFDASDARPNAARTIVISHELWMQDFGGDPTAVGRTLSFDRVPYTIVGILPPGFRFVTAADVYLPLEPRAADDYRGMQSRGNHTTLYGVGRLKPSVTVEQARAELQAIASSLAQEYPQANAGRGAALLPLADQIVERVRPTLVVLTVAVTLLLLIGCVNLANLLLIRGAARAHELAIRAALGGGRWRLVRQLLVEQALLVCAGGLLGALVGAGLLRLLVSLAPKNVPRLNEAAVSPDALLWTTAASCLCAFGCGLLPALRATSAQGQDLLVRTGRGSRLSTSRLRRALMVAEVAVATVLLAGSGLMARTMWHLAHVDPGFETQNLLTLGFQLAGPDWTQPRREAFYEPAVARLRAIPGVESAAITMSLPIAGSLWNSSFWIEGRLRREDEQNAAYSPVTNGYFSTMKIRLLRGRTFGSMDTPSSPRVIIVNDTLARRMWPGEDPIGKRVTGSLVDPSTPDDPSRVWRTVVGVVADTKVDGVYRETPMQIYLPILHNATRTWHAVVRAAQPLAVAPAVQAALRESDKDMPIYRVQTMEQVRSEAVARQRVSMAVLSVFAGVALLLATIGLYGVIAHGVAERTQEIGVRMALGATDAQVRRLFLRQGARVVTAGVTCGVALALLLSRGLQSLVFGVTATDPLTLAAVAALLAGVALAACYLPARRAARVDPLVALRFE